MSMRESGAKRMDANEVTKPGRRSSSCGESWDRLESEGGGTTAKRAARAIETVAVVALFEAVLWVFALPAELPVAAALLPVVTRDMLEAIAPDEVELVTWLDEAVLDDDEVDDEDWLASSSPWLSDLTVLHWLLAGAGCAEGVTGSPCRKRRATVDALQHSDLSLARLEDIRVVVGGQVPAASHNVVDVLALGSGTLTPTGTHAELVVRHKVRPLRYEVRLAVSGRVGGGVDDTADGVSEIVGAVGVEFSSIVTVGDEDAGKVTNTGHLNIVTSSHKVSTLDRTIRIRRVPCRSVVQ